MIYEVPLAFLSCGDEVHERKQNIISNNLRGSRWGNFFFFTANGLCRAVSVPFKVTLH